MDKIKDKGFTKFFDEVVDMGYLNILTAAQLKVYLYCQRVANKMTRILTRTNSTIADALDLNRDTVSRAISKLCELGLIKVWFRQITKQKTRRCVEVLRGDKIADQPRGTYPPKKSRKPREAYLRCDKCKQFIAVSLRHTCRKRSAKEPVSHGEQNRFKEIRNRENGTASASALLKSRPRPVPNMFKGSEDSFWYLINEVCKGSYALPLLYARLHNVSGFGTMQAWEGVYHILSIALLLQGNPIIARDKREVKENATNLC